MSPDGYGILSTAIRIVLLSILRAYQWVLRPLLPRACRFYPSCSEYARLSIEKYGPYKGLRLSALRLLKCHPFHPGGVDLP
ncbi:MAG: membrane protein insertion efficiency factor YidD [Gemmatimonadota bacterium]|nr:membrane protein insertion efficiency factor YidD [Gemmatimonadota bacterium]